MGKQVKLVPTPWAPARDHARICVRMFELLALCGVESYEVRVRMTAHSIVASGWKQHCWHYNAWAVRIGGWQGDWYVKATHEDDGTGRLVLDPTARWRAFTGWRQAVADFQQRISVNSWSEGYREAGAVIGSPGAESDATYWVALKKGKYYTDTQNMTPEKFASICARVRRTYTNASPELLAESRQWATDAVSKPASSSTTGGSESPSPFAGSSSRS